jgi:hypothetical protein
MDRSPTNTHLWENDHMLHVSMYVHVENCVYTCLLCLTSSHWQSAFGWLSVNSSKSFRISQCSSPVILKVVCCVGRISAFAAADFEMPVCWAWCGEHCRVAQRCKNFPTSGSHVSAVLMAPEGWCEASSLSSTHLTKSTCHGDQASGNCAPLDWPLFCLS